MLIRMHKTIYQRMKGDLSRPHPHAWERVGYVFIRPTQGTVLEATDYVPVPDEFYVRDSSVGAHVDHRAIALAMKRADHGNEGVLQVHEHGGKGIPQFSPVDYESHPVYLRSFQNANPRVTHGFLLLSENSMVARVWRPGVRQAFEIYSYKITGHGFFDWLKEKIGGVGRRFGNE
ncbi:hypothetical protein [Effusibacillus consociatus]|uniref:Uncharacterized protein n=1 Tax=Effusibacillus consociatus TaxID=1117041 RepID=A0ABV9PU56_9BACL